MAVPRFGVPECRKLMEIIDPAQEANCFCANCFCASLLRTKFTRHVMHRARALSGKVNNNRAIFYVLGKNEENLSSRSIHLTSSFSCASVSNASLRVRVYENDANI